MEVVLLPGASEAAAVARAGSTILQAAQKADRAVDWPNLHEGLLELHSILDDWCVRAQETASDARSRLGQKPEREFPKIMVGNRRRGYIENVVVDIDELLDPKPPLLKRWRASSRRQAGRRSLRTLLRAYCPELLDQFVDAFEQRAEWVLEHREQFEQWFDGSRSDDEIHQLLSEMYATVRQLCSARKQLQAFIVVNYPIWAGQGSK